MVEMTCLIMQMYHSSMIYILSNFSAWWSKKSSDDVANLAAGKNFIFK